MSYSFSVTANTKDEARAKIVVELDNVVSTQPTHEADKQAAYNTADAFIGLLADPSDAELVTVNVCGYLSWRDAGVFTAASVSVTAGISAAG